MSVGYSLKQVQKFKETGDLQYIYQNEINKACFQHDMVYEDIKDLPRLTAFNKIFRDKAFIIAKITKYDGNQTRFTLVVYIFFFFDKGSSGSGGESEVMPNQELVEELHKPIIKNKSIITCYEQ